MEEKLTFEEIDELTHEFKHMSKKFHEHMTHMTQEFALTVQQYQLLHIIANEEDLNQKQVAQKLEITPATLSVRIKRLEDQEMIIRINRENDKRHFSLAVTEKGKNLMKECEKHAQNQTMKLFEGVTHQQIQAAREMFKQMTYNLEKHGK